MQLVALGGNGARKRRELLLCPLESVVGRLKIARKGRLRVNLCASYGKRSFCRCPHTTLLIELCRKPRVGLDTRVQRGVGAKERITRHAQLMALGPIVRHLRVECSTDLSKTHRGVEIRTTTTASSSSSSQIVIVITHPPSFTRKATFLSIIIGTSTITKSAKLTGTHSIRVTREHGLMIAPRTMWRSEVLGCVGARVARRRRTWRMLHGKRLPSELRPSGIIVDRRCVSTQSMCVHLSILACVLVGAVAVRSVGQTCGGLATVPGPSHTLLRRLKVLIAHGGLVATTAPSLRIRVPLCGAMMMI